MQEGQDCLGKQHVNITMDMFGHVWTSVDGHNGILSMFTCPSRRTNGRKACSVFITMGSRDGFTFATLGQLEGVCWRYGLIPLLPLRASRPM
jgi:hypothetical protein